MSPRVQWLTPAPLWNELAAETDKGPFRSPALLRFATDQFMEELQGILGSKTPETLRNYIAQPETWRSPAVGLGISGAAGTVSASQKPEGSAAQKTAQKTDATEGPPPFKFFQPVHARFYLVSAALVCRQPGLPDHQVLTNQGEKTSFVLRRLRPKAGVTSADLSTFDPNVTDEYAWVIADKTGWTKVQGTGLVDGEERLPLSASQFGTNGSRRRTFTGLIPVSRRQTYVTARENKPAASGTDTSPVDDQRKIDFQRQVLDPWVELVNYGTQNGITGPVASNDPRYPLAVGVAQGSALVLVDFANYLQQYLPELWKAVQKQPANMGTQQTAFYSALNGMLANFSGAPTTSVLTDAIRTAHGFEQSFEAEVLVSGQTPALPTGYPGPMLSDTSDPQIASLIQRGSDPLQPRNLQVLAEAALDEVGKAPALTVRIPAKDPENPQGDDWYVVRCIYEQPQCGMKAPAVISDPSRPFQLASFFDPDAPARPIQVALPVDTTPAALRKYDKGVGFMISDQLAKQMSRVKGLKQLMDGDLADPDGFGLGMICSFSIPIITICAFIVLMIFLILLNIIFWWLPFFRICFPIPTLKAKG